MILENLRKFGRLPGRDKKVVAEAVCGAVAARIALRVLGFRQWKEFLQPSRARPEALERRTSDIQILNRARRIAHLQLAGERSLFLRPSCLEHSLVLQKLLFREGISARLRFGGRKDGDEFKAHAWIEVNDTKLDNFPDHNPNAYVPFGAIDPVAEE
jgi:hypothetical protein